MGKRGKSNRFNVLLNYKLWLSSMSGEGIIAEEVYTLLQGINNSGTLRAAAISAEMSYRKAWGTIREAEKLLGYKLTNRQRGGKNGGRSELTENALRLLEAYTALHQKLDDAVEKAYQEMKIEMEER